MNCPKCGNVLQVTNEFCGKCGYKIPSKASDQEKKTIFGVGAISQSEIQSAVKKAKESKPDQPQAQQSQPQQNVPLNQQPPTCCYAPSQQAGNYNQQVPIQQQPPASGQSQQAGNQQNYLFNQQNYQNQPAQNVNQKFQPEKVEQSSGQVDPNMARMSLVYEQPEGTGPGIGIAILTIIFSLIWVGFNDFPVFPIGFVIAAVLLFVLATPFRLKDKIRQIRMKLVLSFLFCIVGALVFGIWLSLKSTPDGMIVESPIKFMQVRSILTSSLTFIDDEIVSGQNHAPRNPPEIRLGEKVCLSGKLINYDPQIPLQFKWGITKDSTKVASGDLQITPANAFFACVPAPEYYNLGQLALEWEINQNGRNSISGKNQFFWTGPTLEKTQKLGLSGFSYLKSTQGEVKRPEIFQPGAKIPFYIWVGGLEKNAQQKRLAQIKGEVKCPVQPPQKVILAQTIIAQYDENNPQSMPVDENGVVQISGLFELPSVIEFDQGQAYMDCILYADIIDMGATPVLVQPQPQPQPVPEPTKSQTKLPAKNSDGKDVVAAPIVPTPQPVYPHIVKGLSLRISQQ